MTSQYFITRDYSLSVQDLLPPDENEDTSNDEAYQEYCRMAKTLDVEDLMAQVGALFGQSCLLRVLIQDILETPFEPGERKHLGISECMKLGEVIATLIAQASDDLVGQKQAVE